MESSDIHAGYSFYLGAFIRIHAALGGDRGGGVARRCTRNGWSCLIWGMRLSTSRDNVRRKGLGQKSGLSSQVRSGREALTGRPHLDLPSWASKPGDKEGRRDHASVVHRDDGSVDDWVHGGGGPCLQCPLEGRPQSGTVVHGQRAHP